MTSTYNCNFHKEYFDSIWDGSLRCCLRPWLRIKVGDVLRIAEFDDVGRTGRYVIARVTHILNDTSTLGLRKGWHLFSFEVKDCIVGVDYANR